jgi:hypothetical protein
MSGIFEIITRDGVYHIVPNPNPDEVTTQIWASEDNGAVCFYIEPCGQFPDGFFVPIRYLQELLDDDLVCPHFYDYDLERYTEINKEGIAFDINAISETPEADRIEDALVRLGGRV